MPSTHRHHHRGNHQIRAPWAKGWKSWRTKRWARRMRRQHAVVIDTETTDLHGRICELAVVDLAGRVLLDTLINPGIPISPAATAVHGITDTETASAPSLPEVLPRLLEVTRDRPVLAYNAAYDYDVLLNDAGRHCLHLAHLANPDTWECIMRARADRERTTRWTPLEAAHRAAGDATAAAKVLIQIAT